MTKLAIAAPSKVGIGPLMTGTVAQDSVSVNQWNLEALSVNEKHIAPASISTEKLVIGAVTSVIIEDGSITGDKVAAATITGNKISANTIQGSNIESGTITSTQIYGDTLSAISANLGTITAGTLNLVDGSSTGIYLSPSQITAQVSGTPKLNFETGTGVLYVAGEILADKITVQSNSLNNVNFGADVTIGGNLILNSTMGSKIFFDGSGGTNYLEGVAGGSFMHLRGGSAVTIDLSATPSAGTSIVVAPSEIELTATTINLLGTVYASSLSAGSFSPSSITLDSGNITLTTGSVYCYAGAAYFATVRALHKAVDGSYRGDGTVTFYAAATSGGAVTTLHTVTFENGLVTGFT